MDPFTLMLLLGGGWLLFGKKPPQPMPPTLNPDVANTPTIFYTGGVPQPAGAFNDIIPGASPDTPVVLSAPIPWVNASWVAGNSPVVQTGFIPGRTGVIASSAVALGGLGCGCDKGMGAYITSGDVSSPFNAPYRRSPSLFNVVQRQRFAPGIG